jgi:hypothetical protein
MPLGGGVSRGILRRGASARLAVLVAAALVAGTAHSYIEPTPRVGRGETFVPRPEQARLSSFGFDALVADYHWLHAVQIVGGEKGKTEQHGALIARLIDVATTLDPWVDHPYRFAAVWLTDDPEQVRFANRLLERGIAYHPRDWRNRHYLGFNHFYYLEDEARAAEILAPAVTLPGSPPYLGALVGKLRLGRGTLEATAAFLVGLARDTEDEFKRAEYEKELDEIQVERWARALDAAREEHRRRSGRDIAAVEELVRGPARVLSGLPPAHPHFPGFRWELDEATGRIVSSFYGSRYELHIHPFDRARRERWRALEARQAG